MLYTRDCHRYVGIMSKMFGTARMETKGLAQLCRRVGTSLEAGIPVRVVWAREAERGTRQHRQFVRRISDSVAVGASVADAIAATDAYFPRLFRAMIHVGEETGTLDRVLLELAEHYDHQVGLRRTFLAAIAWPLVQLIASIVIIGILILVLGWVNEVTGQSLDVLGVGLVGQWGFVVYACVVTALAAILYLVIYSATRGFLWVAPLQQLALSTPIVGSALQTLALSRLAWTLSLTTNTSMDIRAAVRLAQASTHNAYYTRHVPSVDESLLEGEQIHVALRRTGAYPDEFVDVVETGEESGRLTEAMTTLSRQFQERAFAALALLTMLAGFAIWGLIVVLIGAIVIRIFITSYLGPMQELLDEVSLLR